MLGLISKTKAEEKAVQMMRPLVKAIQQLQIRYATTQYNNLGFTIYGYGNQDEQIKAYASVNDLYAIVNKIMKTAALIPVYEYVVTDEKAYRQLKIMQRKCIKNPTNKLIAEVKKLQNKAMELAGEGSPLQDRIDNPNTFQSKTEFFQLTYLFKLLTGNYYIYKNVIGYGKEPGSSGANEGSVYEMYNLPPNFTRPISTSTLPRRVAGYESCLYNTREIFQPEQIIHGKYVNPVYDNLGSELVGLSPLQAGAKPLTTIANETDYQNQSLKNAGAGGVIVNKDGEYTPATFGSIKHDLLSDLGSNWQNGSNVNVNKLGFLAGNWDYLKIFIDPANMQLLEQKKQTFKELCNTYGVPDELFNNDNGSKYDNQGYAEKALYTNVCLPLVKSLCDDFNKGLAPLYGNSVINYDISDIPELQENTADIVKQFADAPAFRVNDLYEAMGWGRLEDPNAEQVLIKPGYTTLADVTTPVNMDLTELDNNNANDYAG